MLSGEHNSCTDSSIGSAPSSFVPSKWANWLSSHRNLVRHGDIHKCEIVTTVYNTSKEKNTIKPKLSSLQYCAIFACVVCRNKVQRAIYMRFCQTPIACTHCLCVVCRYAVQFYIVVHTQFSAYAREGMMVRSHLWDVLYFLQTIRCSVSVVSIWLRCWCTWDSCTPPVQIYSSQACYWCKAMQISNDRMDRSEKLADWLMKLISFTFVKRRNQLDCLTQQPRQVAFLRGVGRGMTIKEMLASFSSNPRKDAWTCAEKRMSTNRYSTLSILFFIITVNF
jgi:hypothetical protein